PLTTVPLPRQSDILKPIETVVFADAISRNVGGSPMVKNSTGFIGAPGENVRDVLDGRHNGRVGNVLWADGHVATFKPVALGSEAAEMELNNVGFIDEDGDINTAELYDRK